MVALREKYDAMKSSRMDVSAHSDEDLRDWIVDGRTEWQEAYHTLVHVRYGGIVHSAVSWTERRHGVLLSWETVINRLFFNLYGSHGSWSGLNSWKPEKGALSGWLWVVTRNVCYAILRESSASVRGERETATVSIDEKNPKTTPTNPDPISEDVVTVTMILEQLNPDCAELLRLKYYHGMTDTDIGVRRGVGREWANRQRRKCERALARLFQEEGLQPSDFNF